MVPEKSPYTLPLERPRNKSLYCTMAFCLSVSDPDPVFQPIAMAHVLYVYVILLFILATLQRSWAVAILYM